MHWLGLGLTQLGHQVTLLAHPASCIPGVEVRPLRSSDPNDSGWLRLIPNSTDILHLRNTPTVEPPKPCLVTIGGNGRAGECFHRNTVFLSRSHAANHQWRHFVHNGLDPSDYHCAERREDYAVFLAKARWDVKNLPGAIAVARRAGLELHVIGSRSWPWGLQRFLPAVRGVHYHGMLGQEGKAPLLARARCLIFPVRWHEPFGNALLEALVSGCYIVGTPYGSLPEIVTSEVGVLSARAEELAEAARSPSRFDPRICRDRVVRGGFTHLDLARRYVEVYERILSTGRLGDCDESRPSTAPGFDAKRLLPWES